MASIYQVVHQGGVGNQLVQNTSYWRTSVVGDSPLSPGDMATALQTLRTRYVNEIVDSLNASYSYNRSSMKEVTGWEEYNPPATPEKTLKRLTFGNLKFLIDVPSVAGGIAGDALPNTIAAVVNTQTGRVGRRRRGRMKLGPFSETQSTGNQMTTVLFDILQPGVTAYFANVTIAGLTGVLEAVVFSMTGLVQTPEPGNPYDHTTPITDAVLSLTWGTQRTRKYNIGPF